MKEESEKAGLKCSILKPKIMASDPIPSEKNQRGKGKRRDKSRMRRGTKQPLDEGERDE